ncbi:MAG TPA: DNA alkylation repair protein [Steroidobacteraceae bacterium]|nr:DNA alkylation repair protein [Steroidobacteraceae bacterium]
MTTAKDILKELEPLGSEGYRRILRNHGGHDPMFGVKISELQKIRKRIKTDYQLALDLFATGNYDAMYLAGLIADDEKMTKKDLQSWVHSAKCSAIAECTVAWVAAEGPHGWDMALKWINSKQESVAAAGWSTLSCWVALVDDGELNQIVLAKLLKNVETSLHKQPNRVRSAMNNFIISLGSYVKPLTAAAIEAGKGIGIVMVDVGSTACKVPDAVEGIKKIKARGSLGKKRKTVKC